MPMPRKSSRLTKCSICGQPALTGGRLCAPCRSALKRARDTTVSEALPQAKRHRRLPALPKVATVAPPPEPAPVARPAGGVRLSWAIGAACLVAVGIVWFIHTHDDAGAAAARSADAPVIDDASSSQAQAGEASVAQAPTPAAFTAADQPAAPAVREPINPRTMPSSIAVPRPVAREPAVPPEEMTPPVAVAVPEPPPPPPPPIVVAKAPAPKAVPDRWQRLTDQLAACPDEAFKRAVCQESLRIEYCEGFWGRVPPCPAKVEREYGN